MAIDKNSNAFTFGFAIAMVVVVGSVLAMISMGLKDRQVKNEQDKKRIDILGAIKVEATRDNAGDIFDKYVIDAYVINSEGARIEDGASAFDVDIKKDFRDRAKPDSEKNFPIYACKNDAGKELYVVPMVGKGLWGPIWGFVALEEDFKTIYGAKFDHKTESPGLGAEIKEEFFLDRFYEDYGVRKLNMDGAKFFEVLKGGQVPKEEYQVDGITGGTITSKGVEEMINRTMDIYVRHFESLNGSLGAK